MSQNIFFWGGGAIFASERSDQARGSVATEGGEGVEGGSPLTVGSFLIFRLENVQSAWGIPKKEISTWRHVLPGSKRNKRSTRRELDVDFRITSNRMIYSVFMCNHKYITS